MNIIDGDHFTSHIEIMKNCFHQNPEKDQRAREGGEENYKIRRWTMMSMDGMRSKL